MSAPVYTTYHRNSTFGEFTAQLKKYGINCIIDIRSEKNTEAFGEFSSGRLKDALKEEGIIYLSFYNEFGFLPQNACNKYGVPLYTKVCKLESFQKGIKRLETGMAKGYTICLMESHQPLCTSRRYLIFGKYLYAQGIEVRHITDSGVFYHQDEVNVIVANHQEKTLKNKEHAAEIGRNGEEIAALYLARQGHSILDHNWNLHHGCELDLITIKDGIIHFVEVKTRTSAERGTPHGAISYSKMQNIHKAMRQYLNTNGFHDMSHQVDSIAIIYNSEDDWQIDMMENIHY